MSRLESMILMAEKIAAFARMNESISTSVMEISRPVSDSAAVARIYRPMPCSSCATRLPSRTNWPFEEIIEVR